MPNGILDQRQDGHRGTRELLGGEIETDRKLESIGHAHLHQLEIGARELHFLAQCWDATCMRGSAARR